jgi:hypothetical protein
MEDSTMHPILRKPIAAALFLVPLAAATVAQQADAAPRFQDHRYVQVDRHAPRVNVVTLANGARIDDRGRAHISARLSDDRSGVDPSSVRLRVDGRDVTRFARVTPSQVRVSENLRPGRHTAQLQVRDRAGNTSRVAWSFDVVRFPHRG